MGMLFLLTLILWLPSMFFSPQPLRSLEAWARVPVFVGLITLLWVMLFREREALTLTLKTFIVATAVSVVYALSSLTFMPEILSFIRGSGWSSMPYEGFRPPDFLKAFASVSILVAPVVVWIGHQLSGRWTMLAAAIVIGLLAIVLLTYNRSAVAGLFAMLIVVSGFIVLLYRRPVFNTLLLIFFTILTIAVLLWLHERRAYYQVPDGVTTFLPPWLLDYQRQIMWSHSIKLAMHSPWFGNGINIVNLLPGAEVQMPGNELNIIPAHPHNWLVEMFAETGVFGALSLLALAFGLCFSLARKFLYNRDPAFLAALLVSVGFWTSGLLNFSFWSAWWQVCYLLLTAICLAGTRLKVPVRD